MNRLSHELRRSEGQGPRVRRHAIRGSRLGRFARPQLFPCHRATAPRPRGSAHSSNGQAAAPPVLGAVPVTIPAGNSDASARRRTATKSCPAVNDEILAWYAAARRSQPSPSPARGTSGPRVATSPPTSSAISARAARTTTASKSRAESCVPDSNASSRSCAARACRCCCSARSRTIASPLTVLGARLQGRKEHRALRSTARGRARARRVEPRSAARPRSGARSGSVRSGRGSRARGATCLIELDGKPLYSDADHLTRTARRCLAMPCRRRFSARRMPRAPPTSQACQSR